MRPVRYEEIAEHLRSRIAAGEFGAGRLLPSEADLSAAYAASRVTIRRALDVLRDEGVLMSRQGYGWFLAADPLRQSLGRLGTIEAQLAAAGLASERRVVQFRFDVAPPAVQEVLGVRRVLEVVRLNLAGPAAEPFARVTVWCPETLGRSLSLADVERATFLDLLDIEWGGATQTIAADLVDAVDAELLTVPPGSPVLVCRRTTFDAAASPVLHAEHVFPAHRTEFVVELTAADNSIAPSGLRLVN